MYRLLSASKDTYIQDKYIAGSRSLNANVGQAGTLDLYKLFNETSDQTVSGNVVELSRLLLQFDYQEIIDSGIDVGNSSFTASVILKDVYGGQTTPSNFTLVAFPVSKSWNEGRGFDVVSYRDLDSSNFISASTGVTWSLSGANAQGNLGEAVDIIVSGNIGSGLESLASFETFARGDEDGVFNVTKLVSASVAGILENNGFRISFVEGEENDTLTRFVKRFGSRHTQNKALHPKLIIEYNDRIFDSSGAPQFNISQSFYTYNLRNGNAINFVSGGVEVTGSNSLLFNLATSKSIKFTTSSYQANFSASINHLTRSVVHFSRSFSGSQVSTGTYTVGFNLDLTADSELNSFLDTGNSLSFEGTWTDLNKSTTFSKGFFEFSKPYGDFVNSEEINYVVNAINLKDQYSRAERVRVKVLVQDRNLLLAPSRISKPVPISIIPDMRWRLTKAYGEEVVIPFGPATKMSTDKEGMYFDLFVKDLEINEVYELEFLIRNEVGKDFLVMNKGFIFKVIE